MIEQAMETFREAADHDAKPLKLTWKSWKNVLAETFPPEAFPPDEVCDDLKTYLTKCLFETQMDTPFLLFSYSQMLEEMKDEDFFGGAAKKSYFLVGNCGMEFACVDWRTGTVYIIHGGDLAEREYVKEKRYRSLKSFLLAHVEENKSLAESGRESERIEAEFQKASKTDPNAFNEFGSTKYHLALLKGDLDAVKHELDRGARFDMPTKNGRTPLQIAVDEGHTDIVRLLLDLGCDPNQRGGNDDPPLFNAALKGPVEIFQALIDAGADLTLKSGRGESLLTVVTTSGSSDRSDVVRFLLEQGAEANGEMNWVNGKYWGLLLEFGADPMQEDGQMVRNAVGGRDIKRVQLLVDAGVDLTSISGLALRTQTLEMLKYLGEAGVDLDEATEKGMRKLIHAAGAVLANTREKLEEELATVEYLLDRGADPSTPDDMGKTPLMHAAQYKRYKAISLLLKRGADPTARSGRDWTAVDYATHAKCRKSTIKEIEKAIKAHGSASD